MSEQHLTIDGVPVPRFLYGTAWKEDETQRLVELALRQGFRGIDTANQRRHYHEAAVGAALAASTASGLVTRDDLFLQSKFTFRAGQDHRLPYDPAAPIAAQVEQSFASSLAHLGVDAIDSYLLHGPSHRNGLTFPVSKSWVQVDWQIDDPRQAVRSVRAETSGAQSGDAEGWAHSMDRHRCLALAMAEFGKGSDDSIDINADGHTSLRRRFASDEPTPPTTRHFRFWLHFVGFPPHLTAATSSQSMLTPPIVRTGTPQPRGPGPRLNSGPKNPTSQSDEK